MFSLLNGSKWVVGFEGEQEPLKRGVGDPQNLRGGHVSAILGRGYFNTPSQHALSVFNNGWIFNCGATDTMSYDPNDFLTCDKPCKNIIKTANGEGIKTANGEGIKVEGVGINVCGTVS